MVVRGFLRGTLTLIPRHSWAITHFMASILDVIITPTGSEALVSVPGKLLKFLLLYDHY